MCYSDFTLQVVHFLHRLKREQMGCGPASVRYLTAEGSYLINLRPKIRALFSKGFSAVAVCKGGMSVVPGTNVL